MERFCDAGREGADEGRKPGLASGGSRDVVRVGIWASAWRVGVCSGVGFAIVGCFAWTLGLCWGSAGVS